MRAYIIIIIFLIGSVNEILNAQNLKINSGLSLSSLNFKIGEFNFYDSRIKSFYPSLGIDYFEHKYFSISSEIGLIEKGGKESNILLTSVGGETQQHIDLFEKWNFLHFNTTFRINYPFNNFHLYAGFGPKFDILLGSNSFDNISFENFRINRYSFGFKPEIGFNSILTNKISMGFNLSYLIDIGDFAKNELFTITNNTWMMTLSLRYSLAK